MHDEKKKRGRPKTSSWEDDAYEVEFQHRLRMVECEESFEAECKYLAKWFNARQKLQAAGVDKRSVSASRVREKLRERSYDAKNYKDERRRCMNCLLKAARAFLVSSGTEALSSDERLLEAAHAFLAAYDDEDVKTIPDIKRKS